MCVCVCVRVCMCFTRSLIACSNMSSCLMLRIILILKSANINYSDTIKKVLQQLKENSPAGKARHTSVSTIYSIAQFIQWGSLRRNHIQNLVNDSPCVNKGLKIQTKREFKHFVLLCELYNLNLCYLFLPASNKALCLCLSAAKVQNTPCHNTKNLRHRTWCNSSPEELIMCPAAVCQKIHIINIIFTICGTVSGSALQIEVWITSI